MMKTSWQVFRKPLLSAILLIMGAALAPGQSTTGAILGIVTDPAGQAVPDAEVSAHNQGTGMEQSVHSGADGSFAVSGLPPGFYRVDVTKPGFKVLSRAGLELLIDQKLRIDLALALGDVTEKVVVEGIAPVLQTESAATGTVIDSKQIVDLPLLGRNFLDLTLLIPGVVSGAGGNSANYSVSGQREFGNSIVVNGVEVTGNRNNDSGIRPSVDAVQEFKALTSSYAPEFGRAAGGVIAVQTKSGTNGLHGTVYEFLRTNSTTARSFFSTEPSALKQNNFGVSLGGPIIHDKTFFFASYEGLRSRDVFSYLDSTVPSQMIQYLPNGDVDLSGLKDPLTGNQIPIFDPDFYNANYYSQQFPGNIIPANRVSPAGRAILQKLFPAPNAPGTDFGWFSNFNVQQRYSYNSDTGDARIDHIFNLKDRISLTYDVVAYNSLTGDPYAGAIPVAGGGSGDSADKSGTQNQLMALDWTRVVTPAQLNEFRFSYLRTSFDQNDLLHGTNLAESYGIQNINIKGFPQTSGFPQIQLAFGPTTGGSTYKPLAFLDSNFQISDNYSWARGKHNFKFGYDYRRLESNPDFSLFPTGYEYFNGAYASLTSDPTYSFFDPAAYYGNGGNEIADLLLGLPGFVDQGLQLKPATTTSFENHFYLQDTWQVTPSLVFTYGIRYEYQAPYTETSNRISNFDTATQSILLAGVGGNSRTLINPDKNNVAPRIGIAWRALPKTVIRTGWGLFYSPENDARSDVLSKNYPFFIQQNFANYPGAGYYSYVLDSGVARPTSVDIPAGTSSIPLASIPDAAVQTVYSVNPHFPTGYSQMMNFTVQQELFNGLSLEAGYVGALARKLPYAVGNLNQNGRISSALGIIQGQFSIGNNDYNSLQVKVQKRFSRGYSFLASYTYSKSIDNGPAPFNLGRSNQQPQDPFNLSAERAVSSSDVRHNLVGSNSWELPFARQAHGFTRAAFGGWQVNAITVLRTGLPVNVIRNGAFQGYTGLRPDVSRDPNLDPDQRTLSHYFDTAAFSVVGLGKTQPGNAGRNLVRGPGFINADVSLFKDFTMRERFTLQFRVEAFNIANTAHFANPAGDLSSGDFGQITNTIGNPRIMQFAAKLKF